MPKFESIVKWLEENVRKPIEGTWVDTWVAKPVKQKYKAIVRKD